MVKGKKSGAKGNVGAAEAFLSRLFNNRKDGEVMCIQPIFGNDYVVDGSAYTFTEAVLEEILETGKAKVTYRTDKYANLMGVII